MKPPTLVGWSLLGLLVTPPAFAQQAPLVVRWETGEIDPTRAVMGLDHDDDDDDGVPDLLASHMDTNVDNDLVRVEVRGATTGAVVVETDGGVRVLAGDAPERRAVVPVVGGVATVWLVGVAASTRADDSVVRFRAGAASHQVSVTVGNVAVLRGDNALLYGHRDALKVSQEITHNLSLPRNARWGDTSPDLDNVRAEVWVPGASPNAMLTLESWSTLASATARLGPELRRGVVTHRALLTLSEGSPWRSGFVRLVGDEIDQRAPGVEGQTLLVALRDRVAVRYRMDGVAGQVTTDLRVGRPGNEDSYLAARRATWRVFVLRDRALAQGGRPVIGDNDGRAIQIARRQIALGNEIYLQCGFTLGAPESAEVRVIDPPPRALLSVSDDYGLHASGGIVRLRVNNRPLPPVTIARRSSPLDTAMVLARAMERAGFRPRVSVNANTDYGAGGSVDILVRDAAGNFAVLSEPTDGALTTDVTQRLTIGEVSLRDGITEFNNLTSAAGTLEERSLLRPLLDDDPTTVEIVILNRFARGSRIGEAFVEGDGGALINALFLDRTGILAEREAWTQAHEAGHIYLNQPWHPDNLGPDRPWLLMDSDASLGAVTGPKRLSREECAHIRERSGPDAPIPLLRRFDAATPSPEAARHRAWPEAPLSPHPSIPVPPTPPATAAQTTATPESMAASELGLSILPVSR